MKKIVLFSSLLLSIFTQLSYGSEIGKIYEFNQITILKKCYLSGIIIQDNSSGTNIDVTEAHAIGIRFKIDGIEQNSGDYIIHILPDGSDVLFSKRYFLTSYTGKKDNGKDPDVFYRLPISMFNTNVKQHVNARFTGGLVNLPVKMRFGSSSKIDGVYSRDFLLTNDVSLGLTFGTRISNGGPWALSLVTGFALCTVQVDSSTTKGFIKSTSNNPGVTVPLGFFAEHNDFQIGIFTGVDFLTGEAGRKWIYKDQPWLGIAIGYSIFKFGDGKKPTQ